MARKPKKEGAMLTRDTVAALVGQVTALQIKLAAHETELNTALDYVRTQHAEPIKKLKRDIDERLAMVEGWADANKQEFGDRRSIDFQRGRIGWRSGQPQVKPRSKWTLTKTVQKLLELDWGHRFLRTKHPAVDKEAVIAARDELTTEQLTQIGLRIVQEDTFYIESKIEEAI